MYQVELAHAVHADRRRRFEAAARRPRRNPDPKATAAIRALPGLKDLSRREFASLMQIVDELTVSAGRVLVREGTRTRQAFFVVDGTAVVAVDGQPVAEVGPGDVVAEHALLAGDVSTTTVTAGTPMRLLVVGPTDLDRVTRLQPVVHALARSLLARVQAADTRLRRLTAGAAP